jgi:hypothetical protein
MTAAAALVMSDGQREALQALVKSMDVVYDVVV